MSWKLAWVGAILCVTAPAVRAQEKTVIQGTNGGQPIAGCTGPAIVPYSHGCQDQKFTNNCLGRIGAWLTYRPLFSGTPCECDAKVCCAPAAYTFFTPSRYGKCYEPYKCSSCDNSCGAGWRLRNLFGGGSCGSSSCENRGPTTICLTLPKISFSRGCDNACAAPACKPAAPCATGKCAPAANCAPCKDRCLPLPRAIPDNSSCGVCGLFAGRFSGCGCGVGSCGIGSRLLGHNVGKTCCSTPAAQKVDLNNLPILPPQNVRSCDIGHLAEANQTPAPPAAEILPPAKKPEVK
ncbi:MAG: hypothetical protein K1X57_08575 [Gemmataceae bacterium]|nr:hypothetical protein [Gemmataceae bacterium]